MLVYMVKVRCGRARRAHGGFGIAPRARLISSARRGAAGDTYRARAAGGATHGGSGVQDLRQI